MTRFTRIAIFSICLIATHIATAQTDEQKAVVAAFDSYKSAILNDKGEEAIKYLDSRTKKYYEDILDKIKNADSAKVETLSVIDKVNIFIIRHRATRQEILSFTGVSLLRYAIDNGMVGKNGVINNAIGDVKVDKDFAKGELVTKGRKTSVYFHFYKEEGQWRIDLTSLFPLSVTAIKQVIDDSGQTENDFIFTLLENLTGTQPRPEIWHTVK